MSKELSSPQRLRYALDKLGIKISEAAKRAKIPYRSMQNYLRGERDPGAEALSAIAVQLGISVDWLLTGEGSMMRTDATSAGADAGLSPREQAVLTLFRSLNEAEQREIQAVAEEKKRLHDLAARMEEVAAAVAGKLAS